MLKKLTTAVKNVFHARPAAPPPSTTDAEAGHEHSFSCPCKPCVDHTNALTRARLKAQGA